MVIISRTFLSSLICITVETACVYGRGVYQQIITVGKPNNLFLKCCII